MNLSRIVIAALTISVAVSVYVPGEPGGAWSQDELVKVRSKLFQTFRGFGSTAANVVRLAFHDCLRYTDGTGGCDGCLNWEGVGVRFENVKCSFANPAVDRTNNNGLAKIVDTLEKIYTDSTYPRGAPALSASLQDSNKSRADLWSYAAIVAVEYGIETNNVACTDHTDPRVPGKTCMHQEGKETCYVNPDRNLNFEYGRADCVSQNSIQPYITTQAESHPSAIGNGRSTIDFFKKDFGFNGRETAAIFGAHTFGKLTITESLFPYIWTSSNKHAFNNDYYKNIVGQDRLYFNDAECRPTRNAFGTLPKTRWLAHTRKMDVRGGPIFWIHQNHICPNRYKEMSQKEVHCVDSAPPGHECLADPTAGSTTPRQPGEVDGDMNRGCEKFKLIPGADEIALNCEMGLYREFEVTDGVIHGCRGLEVFNVSMSERNGKTVWSKVPGSNVKMQPECNLQQLAEPAGSQPLYQIMEEFATDQTAWINEFFGAYEKMMRNGYTSLTSLTFDRFTDVSCPLPNQKGDSPICYIRSEISSTEPKFMIGNLLGDLSGKVYQYNSNSGIYDFATQTGATNQQWQWNMAKNQIYNVAADQPLAVGGNYEWIVEDNGSYLLLFAPDGSALDCGSARAIGEACALSTSKGNKQRQQFSFIQM